MLYKCLLVVGIFFISIKLSDAKRRALVGHNCTEWSVPNGPLVDSICTAVTDCDPAVSEIKEKRHHSFERCSWIGGKEIICCPRTSTKFGTIKRKADHECENIIKSSIGPINLSIINGVSASLGEFPHMAALGYELNGEYQFRCGGTLISQTYVLTAAHCVFREAAKIVRVGVVFLGDSSWNNETDYRIAQIIIHPNYSRSLKYNDIALLSLEAPVRLSTVVSPACLYTIDADPEQELIVTGWGKISNRKDSKSDHLLKATLQAVEYRTCTPYYHGWINLRYGITEEQLCAADPNGRSDSCFGDSGGPLQMTVRSDPQYRVVGIVSFGLGCSNAPPGVYTRVSRYLDWIEGIVWP